MSFSQFITDLTLFATDTAAFVPNFLENELQFTKEQVLLTLLTCSFCYAFISIKFNITNPFICFIMVGLVATTSIVIECRVTLSNKVYDMGHEIITPLLSDTDPAMNKLFAAVNTAFCLAIAFYSVFSCLYLGRRNIVAKGSLAIFIRMLCGLLTRLPVPDNIVILEGDWPPSTDNCTGWIFNPSGHCLAALLVSMDLRYQKQYKLAFVVDILNAIQAIRLIGLRGHYTIDVITSILIALVVDPRVENIINDEDAKTNKKLKGE